MNITNRVELARQLDYIREAKANSGYRVEAIQKWGGGEKGDSWCCWFVTMVLDVEYKGNAPIKRGGVVQDVLDLARAKGWVIEKPEFGCIVISVNEAGHGHHIAFCSSVAPLKTIAGNTSEDGVSSNGDRVAEHEVSTHGKVFIRIP